MTPDRVNIIAIRFYYYLGYVSRTEGRYENSSP